MVLLSFKLSDTRQHDILRHLVDPPPQFLRDTCGLTLRFKQHTLPAVRLWTLLMQTEVPLDYSTR